MNKQNVMIHFSFAYHHERTCPVSKVITGHFEVLFHHIKSEAALFLKDTWLSQRHKTGEGFSQR